eukprot:g2578.t1
MTDVLQQPAKAVVVGISGFVGSYVAKVLLQKGYTVHGTCRDPTVRQWVKAVLCDSNDSSAASRLSLHPLTFGPGQDSFDTAKEKLQELLSNACGVFMCAGYEKQEPETIEVMQSMALSVLEAAAAEVSSRQSSKAGGSGRIAVVLTSSTGSTNPPPNKLKAENLPFAKSEVTHWSDPEFQKANKRFSPAAKTNMELKALEFVGRNARNEIVDAARAEEMSKIRLCIMNPSWILAPQLQPGDVAGNGLPWLAKICKGAAMSDQVPNDSMSIIHCEDLAKLHVACLENEGATGRFFGVARSWAWEEILRCVEKIRGADKYKMPPITYEELNPVTEFDLARRDSLGVEKIRGLEDILSDTIGYLEEKKLLET